MKVSKLVVWMILFSVTLSIMLPVVVMPVYAWATYFLFIGLTAFILSKEVNADET